MPTFNNARFIVSAIESILAQTFTDYEIIVVDDGSTDDTQERLAPFSERIRYIYQENHERSAARNRGIAESSGEYLTFLDSDDLFLPNKLAVQVDSLDRLPEIGLVASGYDFIDERGIVLQSAKPWEHDPTITLETLLFCRFTPPIAVLMRREWFDKSGGFSTQYQLGEDMDFWCRLSLLGCKMGWVEDIVCQYRMHTSNSTNNIEEHYRGIYDVINALFTNKDLPSKIVPLKLEILGRLRLDEAGKLYSIGNFECAKAQLREAISLLPAIAANDYESLFPSIVGWRKNARVRNPDRFLDEVLANLPFLLSPANYRKLFALTRKSRFYDAYSEHSYYKIPGLWVEIVRFDLSWLLNRGAWSILVRSIIALARQRIHNKEWLLGVH